MRSKLEKILFITEKWCDGDPRKGITNSYHNLFGTFSHARPHVIMGVVHLDEVFITRGVHVDDVIPSVLSEFKPDLVVVSHLGSSEMNPTISCYEKIKAMGIPLCFTWPDTRDWVLGAIALLDHVADVNVSFGGEVETPLNDRHLNLWAPQDPNLYFVDETSRFIPVSFLGSQQGNYTYRRSYLKHLVDSKVPIIIGGGQREQGLAAEEYARLMRSSFMSINFPESAKPGFDQIKGRVLEVLACGSLLLEKKNEVTRRYIQPGEHYVEYENEYDLVDKIAKYLRDNAERERISSQGNAFYEKNYSPKVFWQTVLDKLEFDNG